MDLNEVMNALGSRVNEFTGNVATATAPGAGRDLLGFITNELTKYPGTTTAEPDAPKFDVVNNVITNLLGFLGDPATGSGSNAMLGPIGRATGEVLGSPGAAKVVNQAQKKIIKALFKGDPETLKEVVASPRMLHVGIPGAGANMPKQNQQQLLDAVMQGAFAHFQPGGSLGGVMRVHPLTMKGISPRAPYLRQTGQNPIMKARGIEGLPDIVTHEATHFLNDPGFQQMQLRVNPTTAAVENAPNLEKLATAMEPFIGHTKFGGRILREHLREGRPDTAVNEALSYLSQPTGRRPMDTWLNAVLTGREVPGGIGQFAPTNQRLLQDVLEAALNVPGVKR